MTALWILVPIAIVIIAVVVAFPLSSARRRMRHDHDLAAAEQYLKDIGNSDQDAEFGRASGSVPPPAPVSRRAGRHKRAVSAPEREVSAGSAVSRGRHAAPETQPGRAASAQVSPPGEQADGLTEEPAQHPGAAG